MELGDLEIYKLARIISNKSWGIYNSFDWRTKKIIGDQFIRAIDSIGANIAEGFGRFHYLDRNKFNLNARGSLLESLHWMEVLIERGIMGNKEGDDIVQELKKLSVKLNNYINSTRDLSEKSK